LRFIAAVAGAAPSVVSERFALIPAKYLRTRLVSGFVSAIAFLSEADTGSRQENASKQEAGAGL
jgi:hypothetical protein